MYTGPTTKQRSLYFESGTDDGGVGGSRTTYPYSIVGAQTTVSTDTLWPTVQRLLNDKRGSYHLSPENRQRLRNIDAGSSGFQTRKNYYRANAPRYVTWGPIAPESKIIAYTEAHAFARAMQVGPNSSLWPQLTFADWSTLITAGTTAIARTVPNNPVAGVLRALAELREGIPHVPLRALRRAHFRPHAVGDEFLNIMFGWVPSIQDSIKIADTMTKEKTIVTEFLKNSGKNIFRRYQFPPVESVSIIPAYNNVDWTVQPVGPTQSYGLNSTGYKGKLFAYRKTVKRIWFEGVYTYYATPGKNQWERMKYAWDLADKVYGLEFTPDTAYQLTGWSWLAEWAWNTGDVMKNLSAFSKDGLVMRRGYIMESDSIEDTYVLNNLNIPGCPSSVSQTFGTESKVRLKATPYGFGFDWNGITPLQSAILVALGISRFGR